MEMRRSEDFRRQGQCIRDFHRHKGFHKSKSGKNRSIKLVVVMNAVDWWKCTRRRGLACDSAVGVAWISARSCGKSRSRPSIKRFAREVRTFDPQVSHAKFTRCPHATGLNVPGELSTIFFRTSRCWRSKETRCKAQIDKWNQMKKEGT